MPAGTYDGSNLDGSGAPLISMAVGLADGTTLGDVRVQLLNIHLEMRNFVQWLDACLASLKQGDNIGVNSGMDLADDDELGFRLVQHIVQLMLLNVHASAGMLPPSAKTSLQAFRTGTNKEVSTVLDYGTRGKPTGDY